MGTLPSDCVFEVKPQEVLDKLPPKTKLAHCSLVKEIQQNESFAFHFFTNHSIPRFQMENIMRVGNACPTATELGIGRECVDRMKAGSAVSLEDLAEQVAKSGLAPIPVILGLMKNRYIVGRYYVRDFLEQEAVVIAL